MMGSAELAEKVESYVGRKTLCVEYKDEINIGASAIAVTGRIKKFLHLCKNYNPMIYLGF